MYKNFFKSILDKIFAVIFIILLFWLFVLVSILIYINIGKPILFKQRRIGYKCKPFIIYKFRTMRDNVPNSNGDIQRTTKLTNMIRSFSIDELPQLFNILKNDMSFIGPRPLLVEYLKLYSKKQLKRHNIKPGISGLAQVKGRNSISWRSKFRFDLFYVNKVSFLLDCRIVLLTIKSIFKRDNINQSRDTTMEKFTGNN